MTPSRGVKSSALGPDSPIPDKLYFKIGEVAKLVGVQAHVLRYWQSEIPAIRPSKSTSNQRRYRYKDVEIFREIRRLLYEERYTLAGARRRILTRETGPAAPEDLTDQPAAEPATGSTPAVESAPAAAPAEAPPRTGASEPPGRAPADVVALPQRPQPPPARPRPDEPMADDEVVQRLKRGLKDLIRLAGEEP